MIAAHGNSIRALVLYLEKLTPEEIVDVNIPTGIPLVYEFSGDGRVIGKEYLGDPRVVQAKMAKVAAQGNTARDNSVQEIIAGEAAGYKETSEPLQNEKHYQLEFPAYIDYSMKNHYNRI